MPFPLLPLFLLVVDGIEISRWTSCLSPGDPCRLGEGGARPSFADSYNLSSTSLPVARVLRFDDGTTEWEECASSFVPLSSFLSEVVDNLPETTIIGVLILQAGDSSVVDWRVVGCSVAESDSSSTPSSSTSSNGHAFNTEQSSTSSIPSVSSPSPSSPPVRVKREAVQEGDSINVLLESTDTTLPTVQTYFDSSLWAYHFAGSQFAGNPMNFLQMPSTCSIGFIPVGNYSEKNYGNACRKSALTFAIFYSNSDINMKKIPANNDTLKLLLSMRIGPEFIRICPMVELEESETDPEPVSQTEMPGNDDDIERILSNSTVESKVELPVTSSSGEEVLTTNETVLHGNETESDWKETEKPESNEEKGKEGSTKMETTTTSVIFNFTITVPYHDEPGPVISAEELSIMIQEAISHGELVLTSTADQPMGIMNLADDNIVILIPLPKSNTLVLILVLVVSTTVFLSLLYIGGAILCKARTDFLLEQERQRFLQLDASSLHPSPPSYPADVHMSTHIPARQFPVPPKTTSVLSRGKRALSATASYNSRARTAY